MQRQSPSPPYPIIFTVRLKFSTESSRFAKINFFTVFLCTPYNFAMRFTEIPSQKSLRRLTQAHPYANSSEQPTAGAPILATTQE